MPSEAEFTVPGLDIGDGHKVAHVLQDRLHTLNDLQLTLKHAHWNVVGPDFIGVHEMLDPQIELVRGFVDTLAERMATLGVAPVGTPGALVRRRDGQDYPVQRGSTEEHLVALNTVYDEVVEGHRDAISSCGTLDSITEDILIGQTAELEQFQWFIRAHLESEVGELPRESASST